VSALQAYGLSPDYCPTLKTHSVNFTFDDLIGELLGQRCNHAEVAVPVNLNKELDVGVLVYADHQSNRIFPIPTHGPLEHMGFVTNCSQKPGERSRISASSRGLQYTMSGP
jgi:hypothetical protein